MKVGQVAVDWSRSLAPFGRAVISNPPAATLFLTAEAACPAGFAAAGLIETAVSRSGTRCVRSTRRRSVEVIVRSRLK